MRVGGCVCMWVMGKWGWYVGGYVGVVCGSSVWGQGGMLVWVVVYVCGWLWMCVGDGQVGVASMGQWCVEVGWW